MHIHWIRGNYRILVTDDKLVEREGLVTEDGVWGITLDGEHVTLTHTVSGKRVMRFKSLAAVDEVVRHLNSMAVGWAVRQPQLSEAQELELSAVIRSCATRTSNGPPSS